MPINQDTHYVIKNGIVEQPAVVKDGLELYYDAKGKHNTDVHKDTLLDLSGNNRHGTLVNFAYEGVSGYQENGTGGILLDDVDDKIVRPAIGNIEYTSASRNLFNKNGKLNEKPLTDTGEYMPTTYDVVNDLIVTTGLSGVKYGYGQKINVKRNTVYTCKASAVGQTQRVSIRKEMTTASPLADWNIGAGISDGRTFNSGENDYIFVIPLTTSTSGLYGIQNIQLEEAATATAYTPYVPLPIMTYQMNGNILSFEKDGTVKRTTKDANGNEVVVSRKGINLVRNGNFANEMNNWAMGDLSTKVEIDSGVVKATAIKQYGGVGQNISSTSFANGHKLYFGAHVKTNSSTLRLYLNDGVTQISAVNTSVENNGFYLKHEILTVANNGVRLYVRFQDNGTSEWVPFEATKIQAIDLTEAYGAGNEPDLTYIQAHPEEFAWTPNPNDLIEIVEIKNNIVGDLENLQGNDFEQHEDGVVTYTNEAEAGSVVRVDIDGISDQPLRFRNATGEQVVITEHDQVDADAIKKVEFQGNSVQLADRYREISGTSVTIAPELHDRNVADKLVIGGNTTQYTESSNIVTDGLEMWLSGRNFSNNPATTTWKDLTGVNNGIASGFAFTTASGSDGNGGVVFDGVDDYILIKNYLTGSYCSISFWMKHSSPSQWSDVFKIETGNDSTAPRFEYTGGNPINYSWYGTGGFPTASPMFTHDGTQFDFVTITFNGNIGKAYKNAVKTSETSSATPLPVTDFINIGKRSIFWAGTLKDIKIYNRPLTDAEILQNYNAGVAITVPNIAMPQEIKHVNSGSKVMVRGKNLFNINGQIVNRIGHAVSGSISNGRIVYSVVDLNDLFLVMCKVSPNTQYTCKIGEHTVPTAQLRVLGYQSIPTDNTIITQTIMSDSSTNAVTFTTGSTVKYIGIGYYQTGMTLGQYMGLIQLEESATATTYENYATEITIPVTLKSIG